MLTRTYCSAQHIAKLISDVVCVSSPINIILHTLRAILDTNIPHSYHPTLHITHTQGKLMKTTIEGDGRYE